MASSQEAPIRIRARSDIQAARVGSRRGGSWVIKDPLTLRIWQLRDEEYFVWRLLDGTISLAEIARRVRERFAPHTISLRQIQAFIGMLHREGVVISDADRQGEVLLERASENRKRRRYAALANPLAIRFRGINPSNIINRLYPCCRWVYSTLTLTFVFAMAVSSLIILLLRFDRFAADVAQMTASFSPSSVLLLAVCLAVVKVLHEFGHGMTCRHFGGRCHELGVLILVGVPCLYCNVTDAWTFRKKSQRLLVSAAGIIVELTLASIALLVWSAAAPGLLKSVCLSVVLLCSLGTLLLNGNPLLRFDGYFILADWVEVPNLYERGQKRLKQVFLGPFIGRDESVDQSGSAGANWLLTYGVLCFVYRWVLIGGILWMTYRWFDSRGLSAVATLLVAFVLATIVVPSVSKMLQFFRRPKRSDSRRAARASLCCLSVLALIGVAFLLPLPRYVSAPAELRGEEEAAVHVSVPGSLEWTVRPGTRVKQGDTIATLRNPKVESQLYDLTRRVNEQAALVGRLRKQGLSQIEAGDSIPAAEKLLAVLRQQREAYADWVKQLTIRAPSSGVVVPMPRRASATSSAQLGQWSGTILDSENTGAWVGKGEQLCSIRNPASWEVVAFVRQVDLPMLVASQAASFRARSYPLSTVSAKVDRISEASADFIPEAVLLTGQVPSKTTVTGVEPARRHHEVALTLESHHDGFRVGGTGVVKIGVGQEPIAYRLIRSTRDLFWN